MCPPFPYAAKPHRFHLLFVTSAYVLMGNKKKSLEDDRQQRLFWFSTALRPRFRLLHRTCAGCKADGQPVALESGCELGELGTISVAVVDRPLRKQEQDAKSFSLLSISSYTPRPSQAWDFSPCRTLRRESVLSRPIKPLDWNTTCYETEMCLPLNWQSICICKACSSSSAG